MVKIDVKDREAIFRGVFGSDQYSGKKNNLDAAEHDDDPEGEEQQPGDEGEQIRAQCLGSKLQGCMFLDGASSTG